MAESPASAPPAVPTATGSSPRTRPGLQPGRTPSSSLSLQVIRRTSTQERINDILETGRHRAESMGSSFSSQHSPRMQPLLGVSPGGTTHPIQEQDSSADEATATPNLRLPERATMNYQSTQTQSTSRPRKSALGRRTSSQQQLPNSGHGGATGGGSDHAGGASNGAARSSTVHKEKAWWKRALANFQSIELENKGSVARDHLALERTYLAWLRTSLSFASIGIAVTQLFRLNTSLQDETPTSSSNTLRRLGQPLGATFLGISILILMLGYNRFVQSQRWIMKGKFPASRGTILVVSFTAFALMAVSLVVVIVVQPSPSST